MATSDTKRERTRSEREQRIQRQIAFATGIFQGDITFRTFLEALAEGVVVVNGSGTILLVNAAAEQMFGYSGKDLVGKPHAILIPERHQKLHTAHESRFFAEPKARPMGQVLDLFGRRRDGSEFPIEVSLSFIQTAMGVLVLAFVSNITLRKQFEIRLHENENLLQALLEGVRNYAIFLLDPQGNVLNWNRGAEQLKGYLEAEIVGRHFSRFYSQEDQQAGLPERILKQAVTEGRIEVEGWRIRKDGSRFWADVIITALYDESGKLSGFSKVTRDITRRKQAEEEREQLLVQLDAVLNSINEGVVIADLSGNILTMNPSALAFYEYDSVEQVRQQLHQLLDTFEVYDLDGRLVPFRKWPLARVLRGERFVDCELRVRHKDTGTVRIGSYGGTPVQTRSGEVILAVITVRDITEHKQVEAEIERLNRELAARAAELEVANRELEAFNYTVAHDLRKPLTVINGYCQVLQELCGHKLDEQCRSFLDEAYNGTWRMNQLINALLDLSRMGHAEPCRTKVDLSAMAHQVAMELQQTEPERRVTFHIDDGIIVDGDASLLRVVLDNLFGNAWKYSGMADEGIIEFGIVDIGGSPACFVRDNGAGFDMTHAHKLFAPFLRLPGNEKFDGFGIGLATVERIIRRHGGRVWAQGEPGKGATFYFTLADGPSS